MTCEPIYFSRAELAEGPTWFEGALWWIDIQAGTLNRLDPATGANSARGMGEMLGAASPSKKSGEWVLALQNGFALLDWNTGKLTRLGDPEKDRPGNRFNDGKCDPQGRFWAGTLNFEGTPQQSGLYVLTPDKEIRTAFSPVSLSNGLGWTADGGTMFYIDTIAQRIYAFDFNGELGTISNSRVLLEVPNELGHPDGMCMDANDNLWVALWGGSAVICVDGKTGQILGKIGTPAEQTSCCCFGGENYDELYITSAWQGMPLKKRLAQPLAGCIFRVRPGVRGLPPFRFGV